MSRTITVPASRQQRLDQRQQLAAQVVREFRGLLERRQLRRLEQAIKDFSIAQLRAFSNYFGEGGTCPTNRRVVKLRAWLSKDLVDQLREVGAPVAHHHVYEPNGGGRNVLSVRRRLQPAGPALAIYGE